MAMISERLGGSKTTLYGYYPSKEKLFAAAMIEALREQSDKAIAILDPAEQDVTVVLRRFGEAYNRSSHPTTPFRSSAPRWRRRRIRISIPFCTPWGRSASTTC
jgi:AcrR family transcriptional regulator